MIQKYLPRAGAASKAFQKWIDQLEGSVRETLIPSLQSCGMMLEASIYADGGFNPNEPLLQIPDFNSLIARSQEH